MPAMPKRIDFDDIREGDTIRVVDVHDVLVTKKNKEDFRWGTERGAYIRESPRPGANRKFQLIERPRNPLPVDTGSVIRVADETWILTVRRNYDLLHWMNPASGTYWSQAAMDSFVRQFEVIL